MNFEKQEDNDYLGMLSPPTFEVLSTPAPNYANAEMFASHGDPKSPSSPEGYMYMGKNQIFSPKIQTDDVFSFQTSRRKDRGKYSLLSHKYVPRK